jgi:hypothetical protein
VNHEGHLRAGRLIIIATVACATIVGAGQGSDLERCAELVSDAERLACFDALIERQPEPASVPAAVEPLGDPVVVPEVEAVDPPAESPPAAQSEANVRETQPSRQQEASPNGKRDRPKEYTATVVAIRERPHGQMVVTLDNGETWSEQYASRAFLVDVGDTVTLKSRIFSSAYRLISPGGRSYQMTLLDQ